MNGSSQMSTIQIKLISDKFYIICAIGMCTFAMKFNIICYQFGTDHQHQVIDQLCQMNVTTVIGVGQQWPTSTVIFDTLLNYHSFDNGVCHNITNAFPFQSLIKINPIEGNNSATHTFHINGSMNYCGEIKYN